jgi:hypothetical protein
LTARPLRARRGVDERGAAGGDCRVLQLFTQTLMMALVFALLYVAKYFGFGPLAK